MSDKKPKVCKVVEVTITGDNPRKELHVCAPKGYRMQSVTGAWYINIPLVPDPDTKKGDSNER